MKRRYAIRLFPLSIASIAGLTKIVFSEEPAIKIDKPEPLALQYSQKVRARLTWIRENQTENLMEAAYVIAQTYQNGNQCYQVSWDAGHTESDSWSGRNGEPEIFSNGFNQDEAKDGDLLLASSSRGSTEFIEYLATKDIFVVSHPSPWSGDVAVECGFASPLNFS